MAKCRAELAAQREACEAKLAEHRAATEAVRQQKQALLELAGALKVLGTQESSKPPPPLPTRRLASNALRPHLKAADAPEDDDEDDRAQLQGRRRAALARARLVE